MYQPCGNTCFLLAARLQATVGSDPGCKFSNVFVESWELQI